MFRYQLNDEALKPLLDKVLQVGDDDILYRLESEVTRRSKAIEAWRQRPCGSITDEYELHDLASDAAVEIVRLRLKLLEYDITQD